ncbi:putative Apolipoprotein N-acyltransferase [Hollandina sp. SP2]
MSARAPDVPGKPVLFVVSVMLITLIISFPWGAPLLFGVFPAVFTLIRGEKPRTQVLTLLGVGFLVCLIVLINQFFMQGQVLLLLLASLYFSVLLGLDCYIAFHAVPHRYGVLLIFGYILVSRCILYLSTTVFPFYWTLSMQLLPCMGVVSRFILPVGWEALCVAGASMLYRGNRSKHLLMQGALMVCIAFGLSGIAKACLGYVPRKPGLVCTLVQGGYGIADYLLVDRHPVLGIKIAHKYLGHIEEVRGARFVVLPESAFPLRQIEDSPILQSIQDLARVRNEYIMTGILLEEGGTVYNASALVNPEGGLQNVYRKRTTVLFVETAHFTRGIRADTFSVDGHSIAPVICYESLFIRSYFRDRKPELYIVISNDIFAEGTVLSRLHQAYGVINARTLGIPLLQAMQNGPSFYVDSQGSLMNLTMPYEQVIGLPVEIR